MDILSKAKEKNSICIGVQPTYIGPNAVKEMTDLFVSLDQSIEGLKKLDQSMKTNTETKETCYTYCIKRYQGISQKLKERYKNAMLINVGNQNEVGLGTDIYCICDNKDAMFTLADNIWQKKEGEVSIFSYFGARLYGKQVGAMVQGENGETWKIAIIDNDSKKNSKV